MKFLAIFLIVASAILINESSGFIAPGLGLGLGLGIPPIGLVPPFIPPLAVPLGLGLGGFGLGFGGLGFGRFGMGLGGLGFGRFGFGGLGLGLGMRRFGRSVDGVVTPVVSQNITTCGYMVNSSTIRCDGWTEVIECPVEARLDVIKSITVRLPGLSLIPAPIKVVGQKDIDGISLFSRVIGASSTLINPITGKDVLLWIYSSPVVRESGFFVKDVKCYDRLDTFWRTVGYDSIRFSLIAKF